MPTFSRLLSCLSLFLLLATPVLSQQVTGTVYDADGTAVANATVFVSNTTITGFTDAEGGFSIDTPPHTTFEVVAATENGLLGVGVFTVGETDGLRIQMDSAPELAQGTSTLSEEDLMDFFTSTAFSWTKNSGDIEMVNPEVLNISHSDTNNIISVTSNAPFEFINPSLGYAIKIYDFSLGGNQVGYGWSGYALFTELTPKKSKDTKTWGKNRKKAFEGSPRHFYKSLADDRVKKEEYAAFFVEGPGGTSDHSPILEAGLKGIYNTPQPLILDGKPGDAKRMDFGGWVRVIYFGNGGDPRWERYIDRYWPISELSEVMKMTINNSWITLPDYQAFFDPSTGVDLPSASPAIQTMGYWTFFRLADILPDNWLPKK